MCAMMLCSCGTEEKNNDKIVSQTINCSQKEELMEDFFNDFSKYIKRKTETY